MTFATIMKDVAQAEKLIGIAKQVWTVITAEHGDTHALGQALIEAGQALQAEDKVDL